MRKAEMKNGSAPMRGLGNSFCLHLLIIWSFDFYKEQWGYSSGSTAPKVTRE
jgi:hypothetical protein